MTGEHWGFPKRFPLPDDSVDVVILNCVINLSVEERKVITEFPVLTPGGWIGISDVAAEDHLSVEEGAQRGSYAGCTRRQK